MDGIIFDVDGTLWDSTDIVAGSYTKILSDCTGKPFPVTGDDLKKLFGKTMDVIFATLLPDLPPEERNKLEEPLYKQEHQDLEERPGVCYEGLEETLRLLSEKYPLFIVSNCQCGYIEVFLKVTGLGRYIKDHLCYGETLTSKGQTILRLMKNNGLSAPVYVGDTQGDADACKEAGIPFVFAEYGFGNVEAPDYRISSLSDLLKLF